MTAIYVLASWLRIQVPSSEIRISLWCIRYHYETLQGILLLSNLGYSISHQNIEICIINWEKCQPFGFFGHPWFRCCNFCIECHLCKSNKYFFVSKYLFIIFPSSIFFMYLSDFQYIFLYVWFVNYSITLFLWTVCPCLRHNYLGQQTFMDKISCNGWILHLILLLVAALFNSVNII